ncbi:sodium-dependent transporter [Zhihengliuella alba]|uniref:sodium-dependent transporter n=1 Tax=Zhihengliuella alba TaxID=547018 RepID=UPI0031ED6A63
MNTAPTRSNGGSAVRETFSSRKLFILSAIGSAVGLGNIWRFPYVAYENGGGAFLIPYLVALLTAGIPLLFLDYAIGHKFRGSAPLAFRRMSRPAEFLGWWQVLMCFVIAVYYAVIIGWAGMYAWYSISKAWGDDATGFFTGTFLEVGDPGVSMDFVPQVLWPLIAVWVITIVILVAGVRKGIGRANGIFMPLLLVMFLLLVISSLFLPGAATGLNAFFTPNWEALGDPAVWAAAYGHIFFSLSIAFGIMVTYSSYLRRKTDLTGSGMVVAFANSGFEMLAGIGVFAALGFMSVAAGTSVEESAAGGVGLAFMAFPTIISEAPFGAVLGVLFFGSLVFAGLTSLTSIVEVIISAVKDKMGWARRASALAVTLPLALVSVLLFGTTTGLHVLDIADAFVNQFGILFGAFVTVVVVAWLARKLPVLSNHLNLYGSIRMAGVWKLLVGIVAPIALGYISFEAFRTFITEPYGGYPDWMLNTFGWGMAAALVIIGILLTLIPWSKNSLLNDDPEYDAIKAHEDTLSPTKEK